MSEHTGHIAIVAGAITGLFVLFSRLAPAQPHPARTPGLRAFIAGNAVAGLVHLAVAPSHLRESILYGAFFLATGSFQLVAAWAGRDQPGDGLARLAVAVNLCVVAIWLASRTAGLPVGPEPWTAEPLGVADLVATAAELIAARAALRLANERPGAARSLPVRDADKAA